MDCENGMLIEIVDGVIAAEAIVAGMKAGGDGAVCVFDGIVRDNTRGRQTLYLDYEAYREMALEQMQRLAARRWNGSACAMWRWFIGWDG